MLQKFSQLQRSIHFGHVSLVPKTGHHWFSAENLSQRKMPWTAIEGDILIGIDELGPLARGKDFGTLVSLFGLPVVVVAVTVGADGVGVGAGVMERLHETFASDQACKSTALAIGFSLSATVILSVPTV